MPTRFAGTVCLATLALAAAWPRSAAAADAAPTVHVQLDQPGTALRAVESYFTGRSWWYGQRIVCSAPCVANVSGSATYQIVGDGIATSTSFRLPARNDVLLRVKPGDATAYDLGGIFAIGGAFALVVGAGILIVAGTHASSGEVASGAGVLIAGALGLGIGLPVMLSNATTIRFE